MPLAELAMNLLRPLVLLGTALGIVAKYVYDFYSLYRQAKDPTKVKWDWKGFGLTLILSLFFSLILYGVVIGRVQGLNDNLLVFSVAAQNGFFWQAVIGEIGKKYAQPE